jgi:hypothetical protein
VWVYHSIINLLVVSLYPWSALCCNDNAFRKTGWENESFSNEWRQRWKQGKMKIIHKLNLSFCSRSSCRVLVSNFPFHFLHGCVSEQENPNKRTRKIRVSWRHYWWTFFSDVRRSASHVGGRETLQIMGKIFWNRLRMNFTRQWMRKPKFVDSFTWVSMMQFCEIG